MDKRQLHHVWKQTRCVKPGYLIIAAVAVGSFSLVELRANNQHMASLRQAVFTADKNNGNVQAALNNLQAYVTAHMNTSLSTGGTAVYPPIQLQYTYQRLVQAQGDKLASANSDLYTRAQAYCQAANPSGFSGRGRVPCIEQYVRDHGVSVPTIPDSLYKFDFVDPRWSPDAAGWSMVAAIGLFLAAVAKWLIDRRLR